MKRNWLAAQFLLIFCFRAYTLGNHKKKKRTQSQMCQNCIQVWESGKSDLRNLTSIYSKVNGAQLMECFGSRWGMKEPINRLPVSGFGRDSIQHKPMQTSQKQTQCLHSFFLLTEWEEGQLDLSNSKLWGKNYGTLQSKTCAKSDLLENTELPHPVLQIQGIWIRFV